MKCHNLVQIGAPCDDLFLKITLYQASTSANFDLFIALLRYSVTLVLQHHSLVPSLHSLALSLRYLIVYSIPSLLPSVTYFGSQFHQ